MGGRGEQEKKSVKINLMAPMHTHLFCCVSLAKSINQKEKVDMYHSGIFQKAGYKQLCAGRFYSALSF